MHPQSGSSNPRRSPWPLLLLVLLGISVIALPGCGGCWGGDTAADAKKKADEEKAKDKDKRKKKKKAEKPKSDFEPLRMRMLPSNDPTLAVKNPPIKGKPGHWIAVSTYAKANNFDFLGELSTFAALPASDLPITVENTNSRILVSRPASLPKGQTRPLSSLVYLPRRDQGATYSLRSELSGARGGSLVEYANVTSNSLRDYQHYIVVLASNPASYSHLDRLYSVRIPEMENRGETLQYYQVLRPNVERSAPLPAWPLAWTTTAYVIWDDINPDVLTQDQQTALMDWLHWGGQLVISGPGSLDKLKGKTWIEPFLPGAATETVKLEQAAFDELNAVFSLPDTAKPPKPRTITVIQERPLVGVNLKLHPAAQAIAGTGGLAVERRVGGGRIVVTRFPLTDVRIRQWKNFDNFFNAALLRRPSRKFGLTQDVPGFLLGQFRFEWAGEGVSHMLVEPRLGSTLRYFTRDIGYHTDAQYAASQQAAASGNNAGAAGSGGAGAGMTGMPVVTPPVTYGPAGMMGMYAEEPALPDTTLTHPELDDWHFLGYHASQQTGVAAWNDNSPASQSARQALTEAAGIEIPKAEFVMQVLAAYLLILVPFNWLVFWLLGRVEWAWIAAPIIAVVGAGAVIRLAQLDIGFARSRTEIALLEVQGGYERAHLTRYTALYSSLSSTYTLGFEDSSALALPFPSGKQQKSPLEIQTFNNVAFRRDKGAALAGVKVISNSTGMVHSESMYSLGDPADLAVQSLTLVGDDAQGFTLKNSSPLTLRNVGVFRRVADQPGADGQPGRPRIETAYVAKLDADTAAPLRFEPLPLLKGGSGELPTALSAEEEQQLLPTDPLRRGYPVVWLPDWNRTPIFGSGIENEASERNRVRLGSLARLATQRLRLIPGDVRLVGWTDAALGGMEIRPGAPQNRMYTLVLAHLVRGALPPVRPDLNTAEEFLKPELEADADPNAPMVEPADPTAPAGETLQLNP